LYDDIQIEKIKNITYSNEKWNPNKKTFRKLLENLDKKLIKNKRKQKSFLKRIKEFLCRCR